MRQVLNELVALLSEEILAHDSCDIERENLVSGKGVWEYSGFAAERGLYQGIYDPPLRLQNQRSTLSRIAGMSAQQRCLWSKKRPSLCVYERKAMIRRSTIARHKTCSAMADEIPDEKRCTNVQKRPPGSGMWTHESWCECYGSQQQLLFVSSRHAEHPVLKRIACDSLHCAPDASAQWKPSIRRLQLMSFWLSWTDKLQARVSMKSVLSGDPRTMSQAVRHKKRAGTVRIRQTRRLPKNETREKTCFLRLPMLC
jgi:hypothetical protein